MHDPAEHPALDQARSESGDGSYERPANVLTRGFPVPELGVRPARPRDFNDAVLSFLADASFGMLAAAVAFGVGLRYGLEYSLPAANFAAGLIFGVGPRNVWIKAARMNVCSLYLIFVLVNYGSPWEYAWPFLSMLYLPTVTGIWLHRQVRKRARVSAAR